MEPRARGIAIVSPSCPTNASDPQTEGGSFFFIRQIPSVVSLILYQSDYSTRDKRYATVDTKIFLNKLALSRHVRGLCAVLGMQLAEDIRDVVFYGTLR